MAGEPPRMELDETGELPCVVAGHEEDRGEPRPLLCFLHGYDEGPPTEIRRGVTRHGPLAPGNLARVTEAFVTVAPQLPERGDAWERYADRVRSVVTGVQERFGGDPDRTYLTGFSFGGNGVFDLGATQPEFWAALWAVDPTRVPCRDAGRPVWLSVGAVARYATSRFARALGLEPLGAGPPGDRVWLDEGADHVRSATLAYADGRIYRWLLRHRLSR